MPKLIKSTVKSVENEVAGKYGLVMHFIKSILKSLVILAM